MDFEQKLYKCRFSCHRSASWAMSKFALAAASNISKKTAKPAMSNCNCKKESLDKVSNFYHFHLRLQHIKIQNMDTWSTKERLFWSFIRKKESADYQERKADGFGGRTARWKDWRLLPWLPTGKRNRCVNKMPWYLMDMWTKEKYLFDYGNLYTRRILGGLGSSWRLCCYLI